MVNHVRKDRIIDPDLSTGNRFVDASAPKVVMPSNVVKAIDQIVYIKQT